jgi:hypothetical protein
MFAQLRKSATKISVGLILEQLPPTRCDSAEWYDVLIVVLCKYKGFMSRKRAAISRKPFTMSSPRGPEEKIPNNQS